jgi:hypothetical protein
LNEFYWETGDTDLENVQQEPIEPEHIIINKEPVEGN